MLLIVCGFDGGGSDFISFFHFISVWNEAYVGHDRGNFYREIVLLMIVRYPMMWDIEFSCPTRGPCLKRKNGNTISIFSIKVADSHIPMSIRTSNPHGPRIKQKKQEMLAERCCELNWKSPGVSFSAWIVQGLRAPHECKRNVCGEI
jgi:hypothetical protein